MWRDVTAVKTCDSTQVSMKDIKRSFSCFTGVMVIWRYTGDSGNVTVISILRSPLGMMTAVEEV